MSKSAQIRSLMLAITERDIAHARELATFRTMAIAAIDLLQDQLADAHAQWDAAVADVAALNAQVEDWEVTAAHVELYYGVDVEDLKAEALEAMDAQREQWALAYEASLDTPWEDAIYSPVWHIDPAVAEQYDDMPF